jgi:hypothetical protein
MKIENEFRIERKDFFRKEIEDIKNILRAK